MRVACSQPKYPLNQFAILKPGVLATFALLLSLLSAQIGIATAIADSGVASWNTEIRLLEAGTVLITEELQVGFEKSNKWFGIGHALPKTASILRKGAAPLSYEPQVGFIDSKSAPLKITAEKGVQYIRLRQSAALSEPLHSFILQYKVHGLIQKGKAGDSLSWPIVQAWPGGVKSFTVKITDLPNKMQTCPKTAIVKILDGKQTTTNIQLARAQNACLASGGPVDEKGLYILVVNLL
ncbi:MAG: hypothetical protein K1X79_00975 [Oligoflexia bacterium]|nr:hypothetical protein [Oligoflexia bacterium]